MAIPESIQQKLFHARMHFQLFKTELMGYYDSNPGAMVRDADSTPDNPTFSWIVRKPVPARLGLIAGDCLQNARSALDYLVWELVLTAEHHPTDKHMFPICTTGKGFKQAMDAKRLSNVDPLTIALIDTMQPYHSGETDSPAQPLAVLDNLVNINKHRRVLLTVVRSIPKSSIFTINVAGEEWGIPDPSAMEPDALNYGKRLTIEQINTYGALAAFVALNEGTGKGMEITIILDSLIDYVADEVIAKFDRFF